MRTSTFHLFVIVLLGVLSGCSFPFGGKDSGNREFFVLMEEPGKDFKAEKSTGLTLLITDSDSSRFINSQRILFSDNPVKRQYYQYSSWVETPPNYFVNILARKLEKSNLFDAVVRDGAGVGSDVTLTTEILDFYHDTSKTPGQTKIIVRAELIDSRRRVALGSQYFERVTPVEEYNVEGAVAAFEKGLNEIIDQMIDWLSGQCQEKAKEVRASSIKPVKIEKIGSEKAIPQSPESMKAAPPSHEAAPANTSGSQN